MKSTAVISAAVLAAGFAASSTASAQGGFGPPELTLVDVKENIYTIRNASSGNATLIVGDEGAILIDDKFPQDHDGTVAFVRQVTAPPLLYDINTHMHPDHSGRTPAMHDVGAPI